MDRIWEWETFKGDAPQGDDVTCVVVRVEGSTFTVRVPVVYQEA
ncbi:MAG: hypothetical protein O7G87_10350 [bacterium]|nr:hypothetical protein [bacterium]